MPHAFPERVQARREATPMQPAARSQSGVPFTYFAHQAPFLPVMRWVHQRYPGRVDGLSFVVGTMAPDFAYVLHGSRFNVWAHTFPSLVLFCVPVSVAIAWLVARLVARPLSAHLPDLPPFHLHDYRGIAAHRFGVVRSPVAALVGALTHVLLDSFTHDWGWPARHLNWYRETFATAPIIDAHLSVYRVAQYTGHVVLTAWCIVQLARLGRARWFAQPAASVVAFSVTRRSAALVWGGVIVGGVVGAWWVVARRDGPAFDIIRFTAVAFAGLVAGCFAASPRRADRRS